MHGPGNRAHRSSRLPLYSLDPCGFISFDSVPRALAALVNDTPLAERYNIGRIRMRSSFAHPGGYVANACRYCDALWGSFPLQESVTEFLAGGGTYERLVIGELAFPIAALPNFQAARDDEDDWDEDDWDEDSATPGAANEMAPALASGSPEAHRPTAARSRAMLTRSRPGSR